VLVRSTSLTPSPSAAQGWWWPSAAELLVTAAAGLYGALSGDWLGATLTSAVVVLLLAPKTPIHQDDVDLLSRAERSAAQRRA
jgi:uncharacterized membrane protein (DUF4010 family)